MNDQELQKDGDEPDSEPEEALPTRPPPPPPPTAAAMRLRVPGLEPDLELEVNRKPPA